MYIKTNTWLRRENSTSVPHNDDDDSDYDEALELIQTALEWQ